MDIPYSFVKLMQQDIHLWELCKLYQEGNSSDPIFYGFSSVYNSYDEIKKTGIMYRHFSEIKTIPKNPLILHFIYSYITKNIRPNDNIIHCLETYSTLKQFDINKVRIKIPIGKHDKNIKEIPLYYFPIEATCSLMPHKQKEEFECSIKNHSLIVRRTDQETGWDYPHTIELVIPYTLKIYLV